MILNLVDQKQLSKNHQSLLDKITYNERNNFNKLIEKINDSINLDLDWSVSKAISRNTLNSNFYQNYCKVELVRQLLINGEPINQIIVDSYELKKTIKQLFKEKKINIKIRNPFFISRNIYLLINVFYSIIFLSFKQLLFILFFSKNKINNEKPIIIIDKYVLPNFFSNDRYFPGLIDMLSPDEKESIYFLPTIVYTPLRKLFSAFKELNRSGIQYIYKESFIKFSDLLYASLYPIRIKWKKTPSIIRNDVDFSYLIINDNNNVRSHRLEIEALVTYYFIKRIKENEIKLKSVIDWWENQAIDKAFNKALYKYYPDTKVVGYLGYAPRELELQLYPIKCELENQLIPKNIAVIGKAFVNELKIFNSKQQIEYAPAFRFSHLWDKRQSETPKDNYTILVALPITLNDSIFILDQIIRITKEIPLNSYRVWLKPHPTMPKKKIIDRLLIKENEHLKFINSDTKVALRKCDILIGGMSSICMESISLGIPVLVIRQKEGLKYSPIPNQISQDLWNEVNSPEEIITALKKYKNRNSKERLLHFNLGNEIRENYFEPVTREGTLKLLRLDKENKYGNF